MNTIRPANSRYRQRLQALLGYMLRGVPVMDRPLRQIGDLADYSRWKRDRLPRSGGPLFSYREKLWEAVLPRVASTPRLRVLEFGVAWGYATDWWLSRLPLADLRWDGFDTFTGLPQAWHRADDSMYAQGAFSADGRVPPLTDQRITWHVGDAVERLTPDLLPTSDDPKLLIWDLDLGGPTRACLDQLVPTLARGDVLYFDEAFDAWHERAVIDEVILPAFEVEPIGSTATALAFAIAGRVR